MPSSYIQDLLSVIDHTIYSIVDTTSNTNKEYQFFSDIVSQVGRERTNLTISNQLPKNWLRFTIFGIAIKVYNVVEPSAVLQFFRDSYYSLKVAEHELKFGHLSEFLHTNAVLSDTSGTSLVHFKVGEGVGSYDGLVQGLEIEISAGKSFSFSITCTSDIAEMRNKLIGVFLKGKLERLIAG